MESDKLQVPMDQSYRRHYSGAQRGGRRGRSHRRRYPDQHPQQEAGPNDDDQSESRGSDYCIIII